MTPILRCHPETSTELGGKYAKKNDQKTYDRWTLKLGHLANEQNSWHKAAVKFGEELSSLTDGRIDVQVFPNETLGKEIDLINGMQLGSVDMTITGESLQNWAPMANVPLFLDVWKALGAQPTPMAFSEVFTSLQAGTIDAQENPLALIDSASFNEVQKFVNKTEHVRSWIYLTISEITWNNLSDEDKAAVTEAAKRAQAYERDLFAADEERLTKELQEKGMTFVEVDKKAFAAKAKDAVLANVSDEIRPFVEELFTK